MSGLETFLDSRASFVLATMAVSWIAVVLLALTVANLHFRLAHLEHSQAGADQQRPYDHLSGRDLTPLLGAEVAVPEALLFVSRGCPACERILADLGTDRAPHPIAIAWRDAAPSPVPDLPPGATLLPEGAELSRALGIGVTPFALITDASGEIATASPVTSADTLYGLLEERLEPAHAA